MLRVVKSHKQRVHTLDHLSLADGFSTGTAPCRPYHPQYDTTESAQGVILYPTTVSTIASQRLVYRSLKSVRCVAYDAFRCPTVGRNLQQL